MSGGQRWHKKNGVAWCRFGASLLRVIGNWRWGRPWGMAGV